MKRRRSSKKIVQPAWNALQTDISKYKLTEKEMVDLIEGQTQVESEIQELGIGQNGKEKGQIQGQGNQKWRFFFEKK